MSTTAEHPAAPKPEAPPSPPQDAIAKRDRIAFEPGGIQLRSFEDLQRFGTAVIDSGFAPKGFTKASQVVVAVQMGAELGLGPMASLRALYVPPSGKPQLYAESALAICLRSGLLEDWTEDVTGEGPTLVATFACVRRGSPRWRTSPFSLKEAQTAQLVKADSNWLKWPQRMVKARARAFGLHDNFPDVLLGIPVEGDVDSDQDRSEQLPPPPPVEIAAPAGPDPLVASIVEAFEAEQSAAAPAPPTKNGLPISHPDAEPPDDLFSGGRRKR